MYPTQKGRGKIVPVCRWHDLVENPNDCAKKLLELRHKFSAVVGYTMNIRNGCILTH